MKRIVIVEDDKKYIESLKQTLEKNNFRVDIAVDSINGLKLLAKNQYDLLITDLQLEKIENTDFLTMARHFDPMLKVLILTDRPSDRFELEVIRLKADMYLDKSNGMDLVSLYIQMVLKEKRIYIVRNERDLYSKPDNIVVYRDEKIVYQDNEVVKLAPKEYSLLILFLKNKGTILSREEIIQSLWSNEDFDDSQRVVDVHIQKLRKKLKTYAIVTVRGRGYKWAE